ncbi:alpha-(1-_3)-arabinofuranosyltransferase domain-containing protein [Nocardia sp. CA-129566]|uniref:alpha-(1->3)-arabinofuranosyltransferase domain-containing protein n=1 Tax=Nocardia sp. CA-129566 TaxID=3239976 RepID=UPI003D95E98D
MVAAFLLTFLQAPGLTVADTKYDLAQNPLGFLERAAHLWSSQAPMGQVQNQAYGYFFPHGAFFSAGHVLGLPAWVTQRIWWALLLLAGFWGIVRLCEALGIGSRGSRVVAATAFALSPRVLTTLGSISSETLPMVLAPWVLLAPAALGTAYRTHRRGGAASPAGSALALALMGAVNAVATVAAFLPALLWWASYRPNRRWWRFTRAWIPLLVLATFWWAVPLLVLGKVSPPFLDYIESSGVTTQWASLGEVLRGTDSWTPFVSPERIAGAVLVTQPAAVLATGLLAAAGMAGLAMRSMPYRGRLALILLVGLVGICAGYVGELSGPFADSVRVFLDAGGAPLRNVHKLEPLIRIPLVLGLAQLLTKVPLPASVPRPVWRSAFAHPERDRSVAVAALILTALALSTSLAWTEKLAPRGAYDEVPGYWKQTAQWLSDHASDTRALVVPGAPFGSQVWGLTRDEPLQALASTPWAIRDAVPLNPPGTIRAMDSVQRLIADGRPSSGLAATLTEQGIGILVLRNDLDPETARSTRPMLAHQAIDGSPGLHKVAEFGNPIETAVISDDLVADGDLRPAYPAVEIYRVEARSPGTPVEIHSGTGAPRSFPGAYTVPLASVGTVQGGPEVLERLHRDGDTAPKLLASDAAAAGMPTGPLTVTDTPMAREADFGKVDNHNSALRAPEDARRTHNLVPDYPVPGAELVRGEWSGATITASSSAADATQLGGSAPGSSTAAVVDGDPSTAWISNGAEHALGQWLRLDLDHPISTGLLQLSTSAAAIGDPVKWVEVRTAHGSVSARIPEPGAPVSISLPAGQTDWLSITAIRTEDGTRGGQFGISELTLDDYTVRTAPVRVDIRHRTVLPPTPAGAQVHGWDLGQEFPGRSACFDAPDRVRCSKGLALAPEEPGAFERTLSVPEPMTVTPELTVRTRQGPELEALLTDRARPVARGKADVGDLRGSAFAATDGDPRTSWTAPENSVRNLAGGKPTLELELPEPAVVTGLELTPSLGELPAAPLAVAVNLGNGPQVRELEPGKRTRISLQPTVTDRIELSIQSWRPVLDRTALGFAVTQPPGLAEVSVLGPEYPAPAGPDRLITIPCAQGPTIALGGRFVHTTVTATADELRSGAPVPARACANSELPPDLASDSDEIAVPAGRADVTVAPTALFFVDRLRLNRTDSTPAGIGRSDHAKQLLVLPLSTNVGWRATAADGSALEPIVVNGWQQGWLLPDAESTPSGPITVSFPIDRWYRLSIFGGLLLLIPLILLAIPRRRRTPTAIGSAPSSRTSADATRNPTGTTSRADSRVVDTNANAANASTNTADPNGDTANPNASAAEASANPNASAADASANVGDSGAEAPQPNANTAAPHTNIAEPDPDVGDSDADRANPHPNAADSDVSATNPSVNTPAPDTNVADSGANVADPNANFADSGANVTDPNANLADSGTNAAQPNANAAAPHANFADPTPNAADSSADTADQTADSGPPPTTWGNRILGAIGIGAVATVIAGPVGTALTAIVLAATRFSTRITSKVLATIAGLGTATAAAALSTGPWRAAGGYMGGSLWVQLPALLAVIAVGVAALPPRRKDP